jgi:hypothetical protein
LFVFNEIQAAAKTMVRKNDTSNHILHPLHKGRDIGVTVSHGATVAHLENLNGAHVVHLPELEYIQEIYIYSQ